jgi:hypothetical protein
MNNITIEDIGVEKKIELAAEITANHYKRLIAVLLIDSNSVLYKVVVDDDVKFVTDNVNDVLDYFNDIYLRML